MRRIRGFIYCLRLWWALRQAERSVARWRKVAERRKRALGTMVGEEWR